MPQIRYLNTDLVMESSDDLTPIADAFGEDVIVLFNGKWGDRNRASFEIAGSHSHANEAIECFCRLVEALQENERVIWDACFSRVFDIGYEAGISPQNYSSMIQSETVSRIAGIGAAIEITIYPSFKEQGEQ